MNFCALFEKRAKQNPDGIAAIYENNFLTYRELDNLSSKLANRLILRGVRKGDVIGLGLYNSLDIVIGLLGILKSGGVYLPLDPNYPTKRIIQMIFDSQAKFLILEEKTKTIVPDFKGEICLLNDKVLEDPLVQLPTISSDQVAYIIYTSGSTGHPKGIVVSHAALSHAVIAFSELHSDTPTSLLSGSISFDPSILIIGHTLFLGGTICMFNNMAGIDVENFEGILDIIEKTQLNYILSTPSFYNGLLETAHHLSSLKNIDLCGESISDSLIEKHSSIAPNANLYNTYGPSEYAIGTTAALIYDSSNKKKYKVSIGKCFSDNKIYILDSELKPVAQGIKGEIFVGGPGLAQGYLNCQSLTDESFFYCHHLEKDPIRLYRTGDIGYFLTNGDIVFVGRKDFQVKINGHRVELEEIERQVISFNGIDRAIVLVEDKKIIAFFSTGSAKVNQQDLEEYLKGILPSYMLPRLFIEIKKWPMTKNGKIDRKILLQNLN